MTLTRDEIRERISHIDYASLPVAGNLTVTDDSQDVYNQLLDAQIDWYIDTLNVVRELIFAGRIDLAVVPMPQLRHRLEGTMQMLDAAFGRDNAKVLIGGSKEGLSERGDEIVAAYNQLVADIETSTAERMVALEPRTIQLAMIEAANAGIDLPDNPTKADLISAVDDKLRSMGINLDTDTDADGSDR